MPVTKSATKRARQTLKRHKRNLRVKDNMKREIKSLISAIASSEKDVVARMSQAQSAIDKATKAGLIHKNKAARQKASLAKLAKSKPAKTKPTKTAAKASAKPKRATSAKKPAKKASPAKK